jgi:OOP family OmpA-OmpF porin
MRKLIAFAGLALVATCASAADNGVYLGAAIGVDSTLKGGQFQTDLDVKNQPYKLILGVRPINLFAVEASYVDFSKATPSAPLIDTTLDAKAKLYDAFAIGYLPLPLPLLDIYAKAGLAHWDTDVRLTVLPGTVSDLSRSGTDFAYGAGAQLRLGSLAVRLEYERFNVSNADRVDLASLGVTWTFL